MLEKLTTELRNPASESIDRLSAIEIVRLMNDEDAKITAAIRAEEVAVSEAVKAVAESLKNGGRLIYMGAGTSGRLGVLDASECPPTFNTDPNMVVGLIAGGYTALTRAVEGAEDFPESGARDLEEIKLTPPDIVVGIATSGRTPYVLGGLRYAREKGCKTVGFSCNEGSQISRECDFPITPIVGPEVISGSTRLKAGTATKLVLNMLTTGAMVLMGKTFGNLMVDLRATNTKLIDRTRRIVCDLTGLDADAAEELLSACNGELKTSIVAHLSNVDAQAARARLANADGHLRKALQAGDGGSN